MKNKIPVHLCTIIATIALLAMSMTYAIAGSVKSAGTKDLTVKVNGTAIHYRVSGSGPAVLLIHGYTQTGASWHSLAQELAKTHTVIVPDLRGVGGSELAADGDYTKKTAAADLQALLTRLNISRADVVGHDIGLMVAYALSAQWPELVRRLVVMDAPLPGVAPWDQVRANPALWHFNFHGATAEALVKGRERIYFDKFWNGFAANPKAITEAERRVYTTSYARPGRMKAGFAYFAALEQDAKDNQQWVKDTKLLMPVLALSGEHSAGGLVGTQFRQVAVNVKPLVISGSGHWLLEEKPSEVISAIVDFLNQRDERLN